MRDAALSLALDYDFAGEFANPRQMTPYHYGESPITVMNDAVEQQPAPGAVVPNVQLSNGRYFSDLLGRGFTGVVFLNADEIPVREMRRLLAGLDRHSRLLCFGDDCVGNDASGAESQRIAAAFSAEPGEFILVRPDMHIAARWRCPEPLEIRTTLANVLCR